MKKYLYIGIGVAIVVVLGFIIPPPDGFFGGDEPASSSEPVADPLDVETQTTPVEVLTQTLPLDQIEDEFPQIDSFDVSGKRYFQSTYPSSDKSAGSWITDGGGTTNLYQKLLKNTGTGDYISDNGAARTYQAEIDNPNTDEANGLTLYLRAKKSAVAGKTTTLTGKLYIGGNAVITLTWNNTELETGWTSKFGTTAIGTWTQEQINSAYVEITTTRSGGGAARNVYVSSVRVLVEDQHSLVDNFDSYSDGDLNGQGSWSGSTDFDVQGTTVQAGTKAGGIAKPSASRDIYKTFTAQSAGKQVLYVYNTATNGYFSMQLMESGGTYTSVFAFNTGGYFQILDNTATWNNIQTYAADTWYKVQLEWKDETGHTYCRVIIDDGTPSSWYQSYLDQTTGSNKFNFNKGNDGTANSYFDSFSDPNVVAVPDDPPQIIIVD